MGAATLTIDLDAITANWRALDALSLPNVETSAVVKANAYGLGMEKVAPALANAGAKTFFVAIAEEGAQLRKILGPDHKIFIFGGYGFGDYDFFDQSDLIPLLNSLDQVKRFMNDLPGRPAGVQFDSGMNRLGMEPSDLPTLALDLPKLNPELVISHLACADQSTHPMNATQLAAFTTMTAGMFSTPKSLAATGGITMGAPYHFEITRPGIGLYGGEPFKGAKPVVTLSAPVIQTRTVLPGEIVGYAGAYVAKSITNIATISCGYADGLIRSMGGKAQVFSSDTACPVVGRVSMDLITVDVTHLEDEPTTLDIFCEHQTIDQLADAADTIGYEILTSLGARYERVYTGG